MCHFIFAVWSEYVKNENRIGNIYWNIFKFDFKFEEKKLVNYILLVKANLFEDVFEKMLL